MQNPTREKLITVLSIVLALLCMGIFFLTKDVKQESPPTSSLAELPEINQSIATSVSQNKLSSPPTTAAESTLPPSGIITHLLVGEIEYQTRLNDKSTVYDFMTKLRDEEKITFEDQTYPGLGKLIKEINGVSNSGSLNWIYYVNDKKAKVGVSNYIINPGDTVRWAYEKDIDLTE